MKDILKKYSISGIWHFTDQSNLKSIKANGGLRSLRSLRDREIEIPTPGGNDWSHDADERCDLDKYVHLAFINNHPMLYTARHREEGRIENPVWIKIDPTVLLGDSVRFCVGVANKKGAEILDPIDAVNQIDFEVLFTRTDWTKPEIFARRKAAEKSEILVPEFVPYEKIMELYRG